MKEVVNALVPVASAGFTRSPCHRAALDAGPRRGGIEADGPLRPLLPADRWAKPRCTRTELVARVIERLDDEHPYDVPGVFALPIAETSQRYRQWILDQTPQND